MSRPWVPAGASALLVGLLVFPTLAMDGVIPDIGFEIEGNIPTESYVDWGNVQYPPAKLIPDPHSKSATDYEIFKPAGKFDDPAGWSILPGSVGSSQAELTNIFAWAIAPGDVELSGGQFQPATITNESAWLVMGMERTKKEGTFALDFEFNQNGWDGLSGTLVRRTGDVAVGFELSGNPTDPTKDLQVLIVVYDPNGELDNYRCLEVPGKGNTFTIQRGTDFCRSYGASGWYYRFLADAAILDLIGYGAATMNPEGFAAPAGTPTDYMSYDAHGDPDSVVGPFEFAEAAINLTALGLDPGCPGFGTVHAKSRSSLEVGSDLKDLAGPQALPVQCFIEGYKYLDINGNGARDTGEPGLDDWTINLTTDSTTESTTTANDPEKGPGYYRFENLDDGSYTVAEVCPVATREWVQTEPDSGGLTCGGDDYDFEINLDNRSGVGDFGNGQPAIDVSKGCTAVVEVGGTIDYDFHVKNTGNVDLWNVEVDDPVVGFNVTLPTPLPPQATEDFTDSMPAPASAQSIVNEVTATGEFGESPDVFATVDDEDDCTTTVVDARIKITPDETNEVSDSHTFYVEVEKNEGGDGGGGGGGGDGDGSGVSPSSSSWEPADDNTIVNVVLTDSHGAESSVISDSCASPGTDAGKCSVEFVSDTAGTVTGHASATIKVGELDVFRETNGQAGNTGDATKVFVDALIEIDGPGTNGIDEPHTFTVTVKKDEGQGAGSVMADDGTVVTVTLTNTGGALAAQSDPGDNCASPGTVNGVCTVTFTSSTAGTIIGHASASISSGDLTLLRETDGQLPNSGDVTKVFVDGSLAWVKHNDQGGLLEGATFEVCRTVDGLANNLGLDQCQTVVDNNEPDADSVGGQFLLEGLGMGTYTIEETNAPAGFVVDPHVETVALTLAMPDVTVSYVWENQKPNQGCTPGFWQGGAGAPLWDQGPPDLDWTGAGTNPFIHTTLFNDCFNAVKHSRLDGLTMYELVSSGGTSDSARRAARDMVAAYLNESAFPTAFGASSLGDLTTSWYAAVAGGDAALDAFHSTVSGWNDPPSPGFCPLP